jgi:hypothetical protein
MKPIIFIISLIALVLVITTCQEDENPIITTGSNVLINSSFEKGDSSSADGWIISPNPLGGFSKDVPPGGGTFSLRLQAATPEGGKATITVPVLPDKQVYKLTFWAKTYEDSNSVLLDFITSSETPQTDTIEIRDTVWTQYSFTTDTLQVSEGDSLRITYRAGIEQILLVNSFLDLCRLEAVD